MRKKQKRTEIMLEIIKYFAGKINLSISLLMGVVFPGAYVLVFRNFELFERLDVLKIADTGVSDYDSKLCDMFDFSICLFEHMASHT